MLGHTICATILLEPFTPTSWVTSPARPQDRKMIREVFGQLLREAQPTSGKGNPPQERSEDLPRHLAVLRSCGSCSPLELCQRCKQKVESNILYQNTLDWNIIQYVRVYF